MELQTCQAILKNGKRRGQKCRCKAKFPQENPLFCGRHKSYIQKQTLYLENNQPIPEMESNINEIVNNIDNNGITTTTGSTSISDQFCIDCISKSDLYIIVKAKVPECKYRMTKKKIYKLLYEEFAYCEKHILQLLGEIWKDLHSSYNSSKYYISNFGRLKNKKTNYIQTGNVDCYGYRQFCIMLDKRNTKYRHNKTVSCHILVAKTFIDNPNNLPEVDHKDRDKLNNNVSNLRWVTSKSNSDNKPKRINNPGARKKIKQFDLNNNFIKEWESITSAAEFYKVCDTSIGAVCKGIRPTCKKFIWKFVEDKQIEGEIWRKIPLETKFEYHASNKGRVKNINRNNILSGTLKGGYKKVGLTMLNGKKKTFGIHTLVMLTFVGPKPLNKDLVHHKDDNKTNNNLNNLIYATFKENSTYSFGKKVYQYDLDMEFIGKYESIREAIRKTKAKKTGISYVCNGKQETSGGYKWFFTSQHT